MKRTGLMVATAALALALATCCAQAQSNSRIRVPVNDSPVNFEYAQPQEINGHVMVPLHGVVEARGAQLRWNPLTNTITVTQPGGQRITMQTGNPYARVDGRNVWMAEPPQIIDGRTMVPLRFLSHSLAADVSWDGMNRTVSIRTTPGMQSGEQNVRYHVSSGNMRADYQQSYDQYLRNRDYDRYRRDRNAWRQNYQDYRQHNRQSQDRNSSDYDQYLRDRDTMIHQSRNQSR